MLVAGMKAVPGIVGSMAAEPPEKRLAYSGTQTGSTGSGQEIYASKSTLDCDNYSIRHNSQTKFLPIHGIYPSLSQGD